MSPNIWLFLRMLELHHEQATAAPPPKLAPLAGRAAPLPPVRP